jgi:glycerol-3-phosphate dehydrogenase (NAD+)
MQAAVMRAGLNEMRSLAERIYPTVRDTTFFESCGIADLIATCYGPPPPVWMRSLSERK